MSNRLRDNWRPGEPDHDGEHNRLTQRIRLQRHAEDYTSVQAGVDALADVGGGVLHMEGKSYTLSTPLVLPRTAPVHLIGGELRGAANFPQNRALIEWEPVQARAYRQRVSGLTLRLPDVAGVKAIHYAPTAKSTVAEVSAEWLQIELSDLWVYANNTYHERLIVLEGGARASWFERIYGEPKLNAGGYNTLLLNFETDAPADYIPGADAHGLFSSVISQCYSMVSRGGKSAAIRGRFLSCEIAHTFCDGGSGTPCFDVVDSSSLTLRNLSTEGRNEQPQYRFTRCDFVDAHNIGIGTPDDYYSTGLGNGLELIACTDCHFDGRWNQRAKPAFSGKGVKVLSVDADSARNTFTRWGIKSGGVAADEFTLNGTSNRVEYIDYGQTPTQAGTLTS